VTGASAPVTFPNGACWLNGGATLLVCEGLAFRLTAFPVGPDGQLGQPRIWASLIDDRLFRSLQAGGLVGILTRRVSAVLAHPYFADRSSSPVVPEDVAHHGDGTVWVANALRGEAVRVAEGGRIVERVATTQHTIGIAIGGKHDDTVYVGTSNSLDPVDAGRECAGRIEYFDRSTS
jgi:sugar lactone lactonase YvrE